MPKSKNKRGRRKGHQGAGTASVAVTRVVRSPRLGGPSLPPLVITYTNEQISIAKWLQNHVPQVDDDGGEVVLGLDTETKPSFTTEEARASKGPDTLQLAKSDGHCLVIHLSRMNIGRDEPRDYGGLSGYAQLFDVLNSRRIIKAGVGIENDCLELHENKKLSTSCRLELREVVKQELKSKGLKEISQFHVPDLILPKVKKLQMSNWSLPLTDDQVRYAAADALAGALVVHSLVPSSQNEHTMDTKSLTKWVLKKEIEVSHIRADREQKKKQKKKEAQERRKERKRKQDANLQQKDSSGPTDEDNNDGGPKKIQTANSTKKKANRIFSGGQPAGGRMGEGVEGDKDKKDKKRKSEPCSHPGLFKALRSQR